MEILEEGEAIFRMDSGVVITVNNKRVTVVGAEKVEVYRPFKIKGDLVEDEVGKEKVEDYIGVRVETERNTGSLDVTAFRKKKPWWNLWVSPALKMRIVPWENLIKVYSSIERKKKTRKGPMEKEVLLGAMPINLSSYQG